MSQEDLKIGQIIKESQQRDAIHIAVVPAIANEYLAPGRLVGVYYKNNELYATRVCGYNTSAGVVDPFLQSPVKQGEKFWLFLNPGSITSLRHDWTHPLIPSSPTEKETSRTWLENFASSNGLSLTELLRTANQGYRGDGYTLSCEVPDEFWIHYKIFTDKEPDNGRVTYFSCSC